MSHLRRNIFIGLISIGLIVTLVVVFTKKNSSTSLPATTPISSAAPIAALGFYVSPVPLATQSFIADWFNRKNITTTADNLSVHSGTYAESSYSNGDDYKDITFIIDLKKPHTSYQIDTQSDLSTNTVTNTYVTCPSSSLQFGDASLCEGMGQI